jgi:hypothetical protein
MHSTDVILIAVFLFLRRVSGPDSARYRPKNMAVF